MFKIRCERCKEKISNSFSFCPHCSHALKKKKDGLLDEIDSHLIQDESFERSARDIEKSFGTDFISQFPFNQIIKKLSNDIEKQFKEIGKASDYADKSKESKKEVIKKGNIEIKRAVFPGGLSIQISVGSPARLKLHGNHEHKELLARRAFTEEEQEKIAKLPRKEPEARVRRLSNKVIYEIDLQGVKSIDDVMINKLSNSIEIKAFSKDNAYFKLIPVALPIESYYLKEGKLVIELKPQA